MKFNEAAEYLNEAISAPDKASYKRLVRAIDDEMEDKEKERKAGKVTIHLKGEDWWPTSSKRIIDFLNDDKKNKTKVEKSILKQFKSSWNKVIISDLKGDDLYITFTNKN